MMGCKHGGRRQQSRDRRLQALHPATFLVDEYQHPVRAGSRFEIRDQVADLAGVATVSREQNETGRPLPCEKGALIGAEFDACEPGDEGLLHGCGVANRRAGVNALAVIRLMRRSIALRCERTPKP